MMNELQVFKFEEMEVEVFDLNGKILFNPKDVAMCLEIVDVNSTIRNFNNKQVVKLKNSDMHSMQFRKLNNAGEKFLTESGVYKLIFKSRKQEAEQFQDWITDEVLPQIRTTGGFIPLNEEDSEQDILAKAVLIANKTIERQKNLISSQAQQIEELTPLASFAQRCLQSKDSILVRELAKLISKEGYLIGERKLYAKLRDWGLVLKNGTEPSQRAMNQGLFEVVQGSKDTAYGVKIFQTTYVLPKGQVFVVEKLMKEQKESK